MRTETASRLKQTNVKVLDYSITIGALVLWALVLWWARTQEISRSQYAVLFLGGVLVLYVLMEAKESIESDDYLDLLILGASAAVMIVASIYIYADYESFYIQRQGFAYDYEYRLGWLVVAVILYLTWRSYGNVFLALVGGTMLYAVYGNYVPGLFGHPGIDTNYMLQMLFTDLAGFYGSLTQLTAAWIAPFLLYAGLLFAFGAFDLILRIAIVSAKYVESGVAQTAVISSAIIGSINGSYAANAGMTGSFTIPTMMDAGLSGRTAAGIEGTASTSGQVLPPVMGASAFVMASVLGIAYTDVIVAGLIPAAILVISILVAVHYTSVNEVGGQSMDFDEYFDDRLTTGDKIVQGIRFGVPFAILLLTLGYFQWTVMTSALWTIVAMVVLGITTPVLQSGYAVFTDALGPVHKGEVRRPWRLPIRILKAVRWLWRLPVLILKAVRWLWRLPVLILKSVHATVTSESSYVDDVGGIWGSEWWSHGRLRPAVRKIRRVGPIDAIAEFVRKVRHFRPVDTFLVEVGNTVHGFRRGAVILAPIAIILAAVNGVVDLLMTTGVPSRIAIMLMELSGGILLVAVIFGMAVCVVMGVGMPTVAAYVIVSTLVAPTFIQVFEVPELAAHYMVFYAAVMAGVTPPVAIAVVVASGIAGSNFWRSCGVAITIAAPLFVLPISFIYHPEIVSTELGAQSLFSGTLVLLGSITIIYGLNYPFPLKKRYRYPLRVGMFGLGAFVMIAPEWILQVAGIAVFAAIFLAMRAVTNGHALPFVTSADP